MTPAPNRWAVAVNVVVANDGSCTLTQRLIGPFDDAESAQEHAAKHEQEGKAAGQDVQAVGVMLIDPANC